jgi:phosphatidylinositol glycan class U
MPPSSGLNAAALALVASRVAVALFSLSSVLSHDQLLSTPLSSYTQRECMQHFHLSAIQRIVYSVREGIFLFKHNIDPYSGGTFRHVPCRPHL